MSFGKGDPPTDDEAIGFVEAWEEFAKQGGPMTIEPGAIKALARLFREQRDRQHTIQVALQDIVTSAQRALEQLKPMPIGGEDIPSDR